MPATIGDAVTFAAPSQGDAKPAGELYSMPHHPGRAMPFEHLIAGLERALAAGMVRRKRDGDLSLWVYSEQCVYNNGTICR